MALQRKEGFAANNDGKKQRPISAYYGNHEQLAESNETRNDLFSLQTQALNIALSSAQVKACLTMAPLSASIHLNNGDESDYCTTDDLMTQSLVFLPSFGRRHHPELVPVLPRERGIFSSNVRISPESTKSDVRQQGPKRAISMTRLDQLSKPRQRYLQETVKSRNSGDPSLNSNENCMVRSMYNLRTKSSSGLQSTSRKGMSSSMSQLNSRKQMNRKSANAPKEPDSQPQSFNPINEQSRIISKSLVQLHAKPTAPPKPTRTSTLRRSVQSKSPALDGQRERPLVTSPTRPVSSLSGASEPSTTSSVQLRQRVARKPRPVSIAGCAAEKKADKECAPSTSTVESKTHEKKFVAPTPPQRPLRARSAASSTRNPINDSDKGSVPKPPPPRKPAHVKAAAAARKSAKQQQVDAPQKPQSNAPQKTEKVLSPQKAVNQRATESATETKPEIKQTKSAPKTEDEPKEPSRPAVTPMNADSEIKVIEDSKEKSDLNEAFDEVKANGDAMTESTTTLKKEVTEEEYKRLMMEKRKLAREQAEKEAEMQRLKEEEMKRAEEERQRKAEEEQRLFEEEQHRLAEEFRKMEEEKLKKAMEEHQQRLDEERKLRDEENRLRIEREEQEMKAREEAEKARLELEERLRKDEEERIARKKRVEAIMSRTRKTPGKATSPNSEGSQTPELQSNDSQNTSPVKSREDENNIQNIMNVSGDERLVINTEANDSNTTRELVAERPSFDDQSSSMLNGKHTRPQKNIAVDRKETVAECIDNSLNSKDSGTDSQHSLNQEANGRSNSSNNSMSSFEQLLDFGSSTSSNVRVNDDKLKQNPDDVNSNRIHGSAFVGFESQLTAASMTLNQEQLTDLLS